MKSVPSPQSLRTSTVTRREAEESTSLEHLLSRYHDPLVWYLENKCLFDAPQARQTLHDFLADPATKRDMLAKARIMNGRQFRRALLCSLEAFVLSNGSRYPQLRSRLAHAKSSSRSATRVTKPRDAHSFDVAWAQGVFNEALSHMETECRRTNRLDIWRIFEARVRQPLLNRQPLPDYREMVREFGFKSPAQAHNLLLTAKRAFATAVQNAVNRQHSGSNGHNAELSELKLILAH